MSEEMPLVVRWDSFPFDCRDVMDRFQRSTFNYFHKDKDAKLLMGFWDVEQGSEVVGEVVGGGSTDEVMVVLEGRLFVSSPGMPQQVANPGDLVMCMRHRQTRVEVKERARVLFIAWNIDIAEAERTFQTR
jgi:ethanolamine utilization protein EutQ (cupin superfamily)